MQFPNKSDATALAGIVLSLAIAVATLTTPWDAPILFKHIVFWVSAAAATAAAQWLLHLHVLSDAKPRLRQGVHTAIPLILLCMIGFVERPTETTKSSIPATPKDDLPSIPDPQVIAAQIKEIEQVVLIFSGNDEVSLGIYIRA